MNSNSDPTTFRQFDLKYHGSELKLPSGQSPLEIWFRSVYDKPLPEFTDDDLGIACRQDMYPSMVVPYCIEHLDQDVLSGARFEGELLVSLRKVPKSYWASHPDQGVEVTNLAKSALNIVEDSQLVENLHDLIEKIRSS